MTKNIFKGALVIAAILGAMAFFGLTPFGKEVIQNFGTTPQGGTARTALAPTVAVLLSSPGANATSSSILNNSTDDYYVTGLLVGCENVGTSQTAYTGTGLASLTVSAATTSVASPGVVTNTNKVGGGNLTIATSTVQFTQASTTAANGTGAMYNIWPAGTYLTFTTNATNTAACSFGANVVSS